MKVDKEVLELIKEQDLKESALALRAGADPLILRPEGRAQSVFIAPLGSSSTFDMNVKVGPLAR